MTQPSQGEVAVCNNSAKLTKAKTGTTNTIQFSVRPPALSEGFSEPDASVCRLMELIHDTLSTFCPEIGGLGAFEKQVSHFRERQGASRRFSLLDLPVASAIPLSNSSNGP